MVVNFSPYISHSEPIFESLKILNMDDLFTLKIYKILYKLAHNTLPTYFNSYRKLRVKNIIVYNLRNHALPVDIGESSSCVLWEYALCMNLLNYIMTLHMIPYFFLNIEDNSHSLLGFSKYVTKTLLEKHSVECIIRDCYVCKRNDE